MIPTEPGIYYSVSWMTHLIPSLYHWYIYPRHLKCPKCGEVLGQQVSRRTKT